MAAQVAVEVGADVKQLVKQRDELVVEVLVEEARQAEGHQVEHVALTDDEALHLVGDAAPLAGEAALAEAQRRDPRLQAVLPAAPRLRDAKSKRPTST